MNKKTSFRIGVIYGIIYVVFLSLILILFPYQFTINHDAPINENHSLISSLTLSELFLLPIGLILIFLSIFYIYRLEIIKAITFGITGWIIISIILFFLYNVFIVFPFMINSILFIICMILLLISISIIILLGILKSVSNFNEQAKIRKEILELGIKFTRLEVREISEKCKVDRDAIIDVIKKMIANKEIYAEFFKSSKTISFNQQANIDEIDELMKIYEKWENEQLGKK